MRVIAGRFGGRRLHAVRGRVVRPTADRVREALFSVLEPALPEARVLDLYAGTGALAIEALSRGAASAVCVERDPRALAALERNVTALAIADRVRIVRGDALAFARRAERGDERYDVVFCDPPYRAPLDAVAAAVVEAEWWTRIAVLEHAARTEPPAAPEGVAAETRRYGDTAITIYRRR